MLSTRRLRSSSLICHANGLEARAQQPRRATGRSALCSRRPVALRRRKPRARICTAASSSSAITLDFRGFRHRRRVMNAILMRVVFQVAKQFYRSCRIRLRCWRPESGSPGMGKVICARILLLCTGARWRPLGKNTCHQPGNAAFDLFPYASRCRRAINDYRPTGLGRPYMIFQPGHFRASHRHAAEQRHCRVTVALISPGLSTSGVSRGFKGSVFFGEVARAL